MYNNSSVKSRYKTKIGSRYMSSLHIQLFEKKVLVRQEMAIEKILVKFAKRLACKLLQVKAQAAIGVHVKFPNMRANCEYPAIADVSFFNFPESVCQANVNDLCVHP